MGLTERKGGLSGLEAKGTVMQHRGRNAGHGGPRLAVKIAVEFIRAPPPDQANTIAINTGAQQGHGAPPPRAWSGRKHQRTHRRGRDK